MNPNSLDNLKKGPQTAGRKPAYGKAKPRHGVTVSEDAWTGIQEIAEGLGLSVSELVERLGRKQLVLKEPMQNPDINSNNFPTVVEEDGLLVLSATHLQEASVWQRAIDDDRQERMDKIFSGSLASEG